jgi:hypothetical protein
MRTLVLAVVLLVMLAIASVADAGGFVVRSRGDHGHHGHANVQFFRVRNSCYVPRANFFSFGYGVNSFNTYGFNSFAVDDCGCGGVAPSGFVIRSRAFGYRTRAAGCGY